jgi:NAD(P)-dependent dehydrogenase (short-subunit alcohol dehydrogenase family)
MPDLDPHRAGASVPTPRTTNAGVPAAGERDRLSGRPDARLEEERMDLFDLGGKVAVVTGGTRGIGLMMARGLLQAGARVYLCSRKPDACAAAERDLGADGPVTAFPVDLSTEDGCAELPDRVAGREDRVHILVNNAGATWGAPLVEYPAAAWDKVLNLNLKSPFFLTRAFLPLLAAAGTADDPARVINVGSIDGLRVPPMPTYAYSASKAGLHHLTRVLARELGPRHITVNAVAPGPFESKMTAALLDQYREAAVAAAPLRRIGRPEDMAGVVVYLASRAGAYVTGAVIPVDGGIATTV